MSCIQRNSNSPTHALGELQKRHKKTSKCVYTPPYPAPRTQIYNCHPKCRRLTLPLCPLDTRRNSRRFFSGLNEHSYIGCSLNHSFLTFTHHSLLHCSPTYCVAYHFTTSQHTHINEMHLIPTWWFQMHIKTMTTHRFDVDWMFSVGLCFQTLEFTVVLHCACSCFSGLHQWSRFYASPYSHVFFNFPRRVWSLCLSRCLCSLVF